MIPTYDAGDYLAETLRSVLDQDPGPDQMQIEVVDDHSSDDPEAIVQALAPGRVTYHRQPRNLGHVATFNTCLQRSHGHLVHLLHGDDTVRPGFYTTLGTALHDHPHTGAAFCRYISIDADSNWETIAPLEMPKAGVLEGWAEKIALGQRLQPPTIVVRRQVYERLGGYDPRASVGEDWEMYVRIAASFPVWYEPQPLACYRVHGSNMSSGAYRSGQIVRDLRLVVELNREHLPPERADAISREALEITATTALRRAARMLHAGMDDGARNQAVEALRTSRSPAVFERLGLLLLLWARRSAKRAVGTG
jgi:glycosyltransferase involved in cell wall biosynthesis